MNTFLQDKSKWYVYELVDSRTGEVFYVGKGSGKRMYQHERDAMNGVCSKKSFKIKDILDSGGEILKRQVAFFWDEQAAYDHETDVISEIGLENLTNVLPGGQTAWIRRQEERASRANRPLEAYDYAKYIVKCKSLAFWFVKWATLREAGVDSVNISAQSKLQVDLLQVMFSYFFPMAWKKIVKCEKSTKALIPVFESHGVKVIHGCA